LKFRPSKTTFKITNCENINLPFTFDSPNVQLTGNRTVAILFQHFLGIRSFNIVHPCTMLNLEFADANIAGLITSGIRAARDGGVQKPNGVCVRGQFWA